jgi:hypothetical protein
MKRLQAIANILMLTQWNTIGVKGKMAVCVYYYLYSSLSGIKYYEEVADTLLDEIFDNIAKMDVSFENGLCGVGFMLNYLAKENCLEMDRDTLFDIDKRLSLNTSMLPDINNEYATIPSILYITSLPTMPQNKYKFLKMVLNMSEFYIDHINNARYPLKVANSIIHYLNFLHKHNIYKKRVNQIYRKVSESLVAFIDNDEGKYYDIQIMKELITDSDKQMVKLSEVIQKINYGGMPVNMDIRIKNLCQSFFYFPNKRENVGDLEKYFDEKLVCMQLDQSNINYAFLGIQIIKNMKR